jgi:hypothetical protein
MPKHEAMAQISRPFQIVLAVFLVFACVWLFALQGRSTSSNTSSTSAPVVSATTPTPAPSATANATPSATSKAGGKGSSTHIYHGSAPGLEGLTRDIARAHHAAAVSEGRAQRLESKSAQVSGEAAAGSSTAAPASSTKASTSGARASTPPHTSTHTGATSAPTKATTRAASKPASTKTASSKTTTSAAHKHPSTLAATLTGQRTVEAELAKGEIVLLLFWNPQGTDDVAVQQAVRQVERADRSSHPRVAVQEATAGQVASFGSVTRGVQVYATPTLFVINKHGDAIVLTGLQDAFSIEQTIDEAAHS